MKSDSTDILNVETGIYQHYKGPDKLYVVFGRSTCRTEGPYQDAPGVNYRGLYGNYDEGWRTIADFVSEVSRPELNFKGPRFQLVRPLPKEEAVRLATASPEEIKKSLSR